MKKAEAGDATAQYMLGSSYNSGVPGEDNPAEAVKWYRKAAEQGLAMAQKNLGEMLARGKGVAQNHVEAYMWYEIAIPNLATDPARLLLKKDRDALGKKMNLRDLVEAKFLATEWRKKFRARTESASSSKDDSTAVNLLSSSEQVWTCNKKLIRSQTPELWLNPCLSALPIGKWTRIHQQNKDQAVRFRRQAHGGSAFDTRRGQLVLFGSNTHGRNWYNSPLMFDVARLKWHRLYENDPRVTYRVNRNGIPVAGSKGEHPWAMHTFGAVEYDSARDEIIVSSHPGHMTPGRFSNSFAGLWGRIKHHPTWVLSMKTKRWKPLLTNAVSFFPYATTYDSDRGVVIGYKYKGIYELGGKIRKWRRVQDKGLLGYHNNAVYDPRRKAVIVFGTNKNSNSIVIFRPSTGEHRTMPTPGLRPPRDQHAPMAYHLRLDRTVVVVDQIPGWARDKPQYWSAGTWLYDSGKDAWTQAASARLNFGLGMNYNMAYDPGHNILLLVARGKQRATSVWALRL